MYSSQLFCLPDDPSEFNLDRGVVVPGIKKELAIVLTQLITQTNIVAPVDIIQDIHESDVCET